MFKKIKLNRIAIAVAMSVGISATAMANTGQSSAMSGVIVGPQGNPASDTKITVIHQPSGSVKEYTANSEGAFSARGLRVGGPYTIIVESESFEGQVYEDIFLNLNDTYDLDAQLKPKSDLEVITVTGSASIFATSGSSSTFNEDEINNMATFNRDVKDIVRANPLAVVSPDGVELSIAGSNPKYNSFTIDGVGINDTFGLSDNGYPSSRPPISLDAISQVSIDYAPFTARASKFSGGNVNVVTKSGTNELSGSVFYEFQPWAGDAFDDRISETEFEISSEAESFGGTLGGAIIEDELFFFVSYEKWEEDVEFNYNLSTLAGHNVTTAEVDEVVGIMESVYGLTDSLGAAPAPDADEKLLIKLDWNINSDHRADLTYSNQETTAARGFTDNDFEINLTSNVWTLAQDTMFLTGHLYSDWTADFSSEISMSYKEYEQASLTNSPWGEINIQAADGDIVAGQDENRHANVLANDVFSIAFHATYLLGDIEFKGGIEYEDTWNYNLYGRDAAGTWSFDSIDDFRNKTVASFEYGNAYTNDTQDIAYDVNSETFALYGEANFELFEDFEVTAGVRYEYLSVDSKPAYNSNFDETYGFDNTENLDGFNIFLPRVGFNWDVSEDVTVRGGVGRFSGGTPLVWISNAYTNDGVTKDSYYTESVDASNVDFTSVPAFAQSALAQGAGSTNSIDPNFNLPSDWRFNLAVDYTFDIPGLGEDFLWATDFILTDRQDSAYWVDLSRVDNGNSTVEGRVIWDNVYTDTDFEDNYDIQLTNASDGGRSVILVTSLTKNWDNGVYLNTSYTNQDITEVNPGTSSTAESNYQYEVTVNRNDPLVGTAYYEIEHRLVLNLGYETEFVEGYATNFNLFFERRSGRPFSWTLGSFRDDDFGDQSSFDDSDIYLPYLPSSASDSAFDFASGLSYEEIMAYAEAAGVDGAAGGYVGKYSSTQPWVTTMDLSINQELPGFAEGHKGILTLTIANLANLINDDWGKYYDMRFPQQILFDYDVNDSGQYVLYEPFGGSDTRNFDTFNTTQSTWRVNLGLKYTF